MRKHTSLKQALLIAAFAILLVSGLAMADKKRYVWVIDYNTMERGEAELEHYFTLSSPDWGNLEETTTTQMQMELEVGMTDHWDVRFYQVFTQKPDSEFTYSGYKMETRYRFGERGKYIFDPMIYVEYKGKPNFSEHGFEFKFIMSKEFGPWNVSVNPILEVEHEDGETEMKPEYAVGISYSLGRLVDIGLEMKGSGSGHYLGPTISHGSGRFWVATGALWAIGTPDPGKAEFQTRTIFGMKF